MGIRCRTRIGRVLLGIFFILPMMACAADVSSSADIDAGACVQQMRSGADGAVLIAPAKKSVADAESIPPADLVPEIPTWSLPCTKTPALIAPPMLEAVPDASPGADGSALSIPPADDTAAPGLAIAEVPVSSKTTEQNVPDKFSNACVPPKSWKNVYVPKCMADLQAQVGKEFNVARRGPFLISSDLAAGDFSRMVDGVLACCRDCLQNDYFDTPPDAVVTLYIFRDEKSYNAGLKRMFGMDPISPYGHYGHSRRYIVVNYDTGPGTLVHELTHSLMAPDFPAAPIWISEGIASLYEQCRVDGRSLKGEANWRLPELKDCLKKKTQAALEELFAMPPRAFRAKHESLHYAQSRYFCKFLEENGHLRKVYRTFRDRYAEDPSGIRFIEEAFGQPLAHIETRWHVWLKTQTWR